VEAGIFAWERLEEQAERAEREAKEYEEDDTEWLIEALNTTITDEKKHEEALSRARRMRTSRRPKPPRSAGPSPETPTGRTPSPSSRATRPP
jgi:hypothetical protein